MDNEVKAKFANYPPLPRAFLEDLRNQIFKLAATLDLGEVQETLKWGEPSYSVKTGSPVRLNWKEKTPQQIFIYFNCQTNLVDTFRELYDEVLQFEGNRAIVLLLDAPCPKPALQHCLELALTYKSRKHLPLLGA